MLKKVAFILLLVACSHESDESATTTTGAPAPAPAPRPVAPTETAQPTAPTETALPAAPAPTETALPAAPAPTRAPTGDWRVRVSSELAAMKTSAPQVLDELTKLAPTMTRARFVRFTSDAVHDPRAAAVFIDRLARGGESEEVRAALIEALPRTGGAYADAAVDLMASEPSALVRASYVFAARRAPAAQAITLVQRGLADASAEVQAEAARTAAAHPDGKRLAAELRATLAAPDPAVRAEVARTLGILKIAAARDQLVAQLDDASADVRLESLRAIDRIEPGFAKTLPLGKLAKDADPRITALVSRLTAAPSAN